MANTNRKKKPTTLPPPPPLAPVAPRQNDLPTRKDVELVEAWAAITKRTGRTPTVRSIADELGLSATGAQMRINQAAAKGLLVREYVRKPGPYQVSKEGERWLTTIAK